MGSKLNWGGRGVPTGEAVEGCSSNASSCSGSCCAARVVSWINVAGLGVVITSAGGAGSGSVAVVVARLR